MNRIQKILLGALAVLTVTAFSFANPAVQGSLQTSEGASNRPNVVLIYGDDVGFSDVSAYGNTQLGTPNIDRLAKSGLRFTDGHCTAATCTPSRFSLLTGVHAFREGVSIAPPNEPMLISVDAVTLPQVFKKAGYQTGIVGKWHLGLGSEETGPDWNGILSPGPLEIGFDTAYILPTTNDRVPCVYVDGHRVENLDPQDPIYVGDTFESVNIEGSTQYPNARDLGIEEPFYKSVINGIGRIGYMSGGKAALWDDYTSTEVFVEKALEFITKHKTEPFFLMYSAQDIHIPNAPNKRFHGKTELGSRGDAMVQLDWAVGEILDLLEANGLTENTIIIFSSDNGPTHHDDNYPSTPEVARYSPNSGNGHDASGPWKGGKYEIYEGGTRVPFIVSWKNHIESGVSDALVSQIDLLASFAGFFEVKLHEEGAIDSRDTLSSFWGTDKHGLDYILEEGRGLALRIGKWKYFPARKTKRAKGFVPEVESLYDLESDPGEEQNLIELHPKRAAEFRTLLEDICNGEGLRDLEPKLEA